MTMLSEAIAELDKLKASRDKILNAQHYMADGNQVTRANLAEVNSEIKRYERIVSRKKRGGIRVRGATPRG